MEVLRSFQQASALDQALLSDVRAAVQELHDRIQYRAGALGDAIVTVHGGYQKVLDELQTIYKQCCGRTATHLEGIDSES